MNISYCHDPELVIGRIIVYRETLVSNKRMSLTWTDKMFLIRSIHLFGLDEEVSEPIDVLVPTMGMSYVQMNEARQRLEEWGVVENLTVHTERGRPRQGFIIFSEDLLALLGDPIDLPEGLQLHQHNIKSLLCWGKLDYEACDDLGAGAYIRSKRAYLKDENHSLDVKSRMFISVMLAHADEHGFVHRLGKSEIKYLTGMDNDQQRRQVKKLLQQGYIRSLIKGFTDSNVFGLVPTVYCINILKGSQALDGKPKHGIILHRSSQGDYAEVRTEAQQFFVLAKRFLSKSRHEPEKIILVRSFLGKHYTTLNFPSVPNDSFQLLRKIVLVDYLQHRLESYAFWFLSVPGFDGTKESISEDKYLGIRNRVFHDIATHQNPRDGDLVEVSKEPAMQSLILLADMLSQVALVMGRSYYDLIGQCQSNDIETENCNFRVLPRIGKKSVGEFGNLYIAISCHCHSDLELVSQDSLSLIELRDHRVDLNNERRALIKRKLKKANDQINQNLEANIKALENKPKFSMKSYLSEEAIDMELRRQCGLRS